MEPHEWTERLERAKSQRMYLVNSERVGSEYHFSVMGNTDKAYKVIIGKQIKCSCPDCARSHKFCKHLMLLLIRMLGLSEESVRENLFTVTDRCIDECQNYFTKKSAPQEPEELKQELRKPLDDDCCPICFEDLVTTEEIIYCTTCGKNIHQDCFRKWQKPSCVYCRANMVQCARKRKSEWSP